MGEPPLWLVVGVLVAMFLVNVYSYPAWQHRRIGNWYDTAIAATVAGVLVGIFVGSLVLFVIAVSAHLILGVYAAIIWHRTPKDHHDRPRHGGPREAPTATMNDR